MFIFVIVPGGIGIFEDRGHPRPVRGRDPPRSGGRGQAQPDVFKNPISSGTENGSVYEKKIIAYITMYAVDSYCLYKGEADRSRS